MQSLITANIVSAIFLLTQILGILSKNLAKSRSSVVLRFGSYSIVLCCALDALCHICDGHGLPDFLIYFLYILSYSAGCLPVISYSYYSYVYISEKTKTNKITFVIPMLISFLNFLYIIVCGISGKILAVQNGTAIMTGGMPDSANIINMATILYLPVIALIKYKRIGVPLLLLLGSFGLTPAVTSTLSIITGCINYSYPAAAVSVAIIINLLENKNSFEIELKQQQMLVESNRVLEENLKIIQSMSSIYFASYYIDLVNDTFVELSSKENIRNTVKSKVKAQEALFFAVEKLMAPEFTNTMKTFFDLSTIQERLKNKNAVSQRYIGVTSGWSLAYLIAGDRDQNGNLLHIFYACRTIHDEKAREDAQNRKLEECFDIINKAGLGLWKIKLSENGHSTLEANEKMKELLAIDKMNLSDEEAFNFWFSRIAPESMQSVNSSIETIKSGKFSENTYTWNNPIKGNVYVRCGGTSEKQQDGSYILQGYHTDVTSIVLEEEIQRRTKEFLHNEKQMTRMMVFLLGALGTVVEFRSLESGDHVKRVMTFTKIILNKVKEKYPKYNLTDSQIDLMSQAAALHDVGKIGISDEILKAPRKLTTEEFEHMKTHTIIGCEILDRFKILDNDFYKYCYDICRWHHEKDDGKGYPDGLSGDQIPIYCQATSVADCFDALVSKRVYKDAIPEVAAFNMIMNGECGKFSNAILDCFESARSDLFDFVHECDMQN